MGAEDALRDPIRAQVLADVLGRPELRERQDDEGELLRHDELIGAVPLGAIDQ